MTGPSPQCHCHPDGNKKNRLVVDLEQWKDISIFQKVFKHIFHRFFLHLQLLNMIRFLRGISYDKRYRSCRAITYWPWQSWYLWYHGIVIWQTIFFSTNYHYKKILSKKCNVRNAFFFIYFHNKWKGVNKNEYNTITCLTPSRTLR